MQLDKTVEEMSQQPLSLVVNDAGIEHSLAVKAAALNSSGELELTTDFDLNLLPAMKVADAQAMLEAKLGQKGPFIEALARKLCHEALMSLEPSASA